MGITIICCSSLFYKRGYSQNPPPVPLQEAHRPAILKLRHRPTSVQDVPICEPLARTDHEPKAHLCMFEFRKVCWCVPSYVYFVVYLQFPLHLLYLMFNLFLSLHNTKLFLKYRKKLILHIAFSSWQTYNKCINREWCIQKNEQVYTCSAEGVTLSGVERHETVCGHNSGEFRSIGRRRCKGLDFQALISQAKGQGADMVTPCVVEENFIKSAGLLFFFVKELAVFLLGA